MTLGNRIFWSVFAFIGTNFIWIAFLGSPLRFYGSGLILALVITFILFKFVLPKG
jgi:hypothetical protein